MNDAQGQTMTNAAVTGTVITNGSNVLTVKFRGGDSELIVDPGVPVTRIDVVDKSTVKSGARVRVPTLSRRRAGTSAHARRDPAAARKGLLAFA